MSVCLHATLGVTGSKKGCRKGLQEEVTGRGLQEQGYGKGLREEGCRSRVTGRGCRKRGCRKQKGLQEGVAGRPSLTQPAHATPFWWCSQFAATVSSLRMSYVK